MPIQAPSWTDFLSCPICCNEFATSQRLPISLGCGHTICRLCLATLHNRQCPFDQTSIISDVDSLPVNNALLQLVNTTNDNNANNDGNNFGCSGSSGNSVSNKKLTDAAVKVNNNTNFAGENSVLGAAIAGVEPSSVRRLDAEDLELYKSCRTCIENLALQLKCPGTNSTTSFSTILSRPMQRKLVTLINCQLMEEEGRVRALRAARSLGERTVMELILQHQNAQLLSSNLWAAVRSRGCQFLGPSMQEEVLKLVLLALEDGSALSRKVLVMFVVQRLEPHFPQASKTSIGHVVQLLYRASCFKVSKREADSSLMQLKEEFRTYEALRREHDAQIVQIATEAGLRIAPDQWSSLLYGDTMHKSHMQSISDKLQTPSSFAQAVQELVIALQRTGDPANLSVLRSHLKHLAGIEPNSETDPPTWEVLATALNSVRLVVLGLVDFLQHHGSRKLQEATTGPSNSNHKYKISLCRDLAVRQVCPRGTSCTFAHSEEELERYRARNRKSSKPSSQNSIGLKKSYPSLSNPHQNHQSPHRVAFNHNEETISPTSSAHSPMRLTTSNLGNLPSNNFMEANSPMHNPHGQSSLGTHHINQPPLRSPIPPTNGQMMGGVIPPPPPPIVVPPMHQRFETPFASLNYPKPPMSVMTSIGVSATLSPLSFAGGMKRGPRPPIANMTTVNPPTFADNAPLNNNGLYNMIANDLYHANYNAGLPNVNPQHMSMPHPNPFFASGSGDNNPTVDFPNSSRSPLNPLWDQQQRLPIMGSMPNISGAEYLRSFSQITFRQSPADGTFFCNNKTSAPSIEHLEKSRNANETHDFKNEFGIGCISGVNNNNNNCFFNGAQPSPRDQSYPCSVGSGNDNVTRSLFMNNAAAGRENTPIGHEVGTAAGGGLRSSLTYFRDRDNFVRSDSILDDDGTSYDVPTSTASFGSKFGPICPMYKDSATAVPPTAARPPNFLDNWSGTASEANVTRMVDPNMDLKFSVFPEAAPGSDRVKTAKYNVEKPHLHSMNVVLSGLNDMHFSANSAEQPTTSRGKENTNGCGLGLNSLNMMGYMENGGGNVGTQASSLSDAFQWTPFANLDSNCIWNRSSTPPSSAKLGEASSKAPLKGQQQEQLAKQVQQQQQHAAKPLPPTTQAAVGSEEGSEGGIDSVMMRDIEQKLVEIVEKVWSNSDDSGIKLD